MGFFDRFRREKANSYIQTPMTGGRVSVDEDLSVGQFFSSLANSYGSMANKLPFELYEYVELVALYNADFSQAVDNVKNLANPGFNILVNSKDESKAAKYREKLTQIERKIKPKFGGFHGIANGLVRQGAIYGAMCGEWIINADLTDVVDFVFLNPKNIRFFWDEEEQDWHPYQKVDMLQVEMAKKRGQEIRNLDCIRLNTTTFIYYNAFALNNNPYGVPPFISSLEPIEVQRQLLNNLKSITKKMGMLGILEVVIERLPMEAEETFNQYLARCQAFLLNYQGLIQNMVNEGGIVHFDDSEVKNLSIAEKAEGAEKLFTLNEEQIFSGLHTMPSVQGRSYSTTETYASVSYEILLRSIGDFTMGAKYIIEQGCWLMDKVWGIGVDEITLDFNENKAVNQLQKAQAEAISINTDLTLWRNKILNQTNVAQRHGIDVPVEPLDAPVESKPTQPPNLQPQTTPDGSQPAADGSQPDTVPPPKKPPKPPANQGGKVYTVEFEQEEDNG